MVGAFLFALDTTIVNIAIPKIMTSISADLNQIEWVLIIYMIGMAIVMPANRLADDVFGHKRLYTGSLAHIHHQLCPVRYGMESSLADLFSFPAGYRRRRHCPHRHGHHFPRLSSPAARPGDGDLFAGLYVWSHPRSHPGRLSDRYAQLASHFLH